MMNEELNQSAKMLLNAYIQICESDYQLEQIGATKEELRTELEQLLLYDDDYAVLDDDVIPFLLKLIIRIK